MLLCLERSFLYRFSENKDGIYPELFIMKWLLTNSEGKTFNNFFSLIFSLLKHIHYFCCLNHWTD